MFDMGDGMNWGWLFGVLSIKIIALIFVISIIALLLGLSKLWV